MVWIIFNVLKEQLSLCNKKQLQDQLHQGEHMAAIETIENYHRVLSTADGKELL